MPLPTAGATGDSDTGVEEEGIVLRSPRVALPATYCLTPAFDERFGRAEAETALAVWQDMVPDTTLFTAVEDCQDATVTFDSDETSKLLFQVQVANAVPVTARLIAFSADMLITDAEVAKSGCPSALHASVSRLLARSMGLAIGIPPSCEAGEPCEDPDAQDALMHWVLPLNCAPTATSPWDEEAMALVAAANSL